tara:strand:- start:212 stop:778 length:567 start_codon:yes stop_codon:yes gene_type:complete
MSKNLYAKRMKNWWPTSDLDNVKNSHGLEKINFKEAAVEHYRLIIQSKYDGDDICAICLASMKSDMVKHTPCGHVFHCKCLNKMFESNGPSRYNCPQCRAPLIDSMFNNETETANDGDIDDDGDYTDVEDELTGGYNADTNMTEAVLPDIPADFLGDEGELLNALGEITDNNFINTFGTDIWQPPPQS